MKVLNENHHEIFEDIVKDIKKYYLTIDNIVTYSTSPEKVALLVSESELPIAKEFKDIVKAMGGLNTKEIAVINGLSLLKTYLTNLIVDINKDIESFNSNDLISIVKDNLVTLEEFMTPDSLNAAINSLTKDSTMVEYSSNKLPSSIMNSLSETVGDVDMISETLDIILQKIKHDEVVEESDRLKVIFKEVNTINTTTEVKLKVLSEGKEYLGNSNITPIKLNDTDVDLELSESLSSYIEKYKASGADNSLTLLTDIGNSLVSIEKNMLFNMDSIPKLNLDTLSVCIKTMDDTANSFNTNELTDGDLVKASQELRDYTNITINNYTELIYKYVDAIQDINKHVKFISICKTTFERIILDIAISDSASIK